MTRPQFHWSPEDDETLITARRAGRTYAEIRADLFPHRSEVSISKRGKRLIAAGRLEKVPYAARDNESLRDFDDMVRAGTAALLAAQMRVYRPVNA